jgi:hypothetical protein
MNFLLRFLMASVLRVLFWLLIILGRFLLLPLLALIARLFVDLVSLSFGAAANGPTAFIDRLAGEWTERFHEVVEDREHMNEIYHLCRFMVGVLVVLGWLVSTIFTIMLLRVVFGFFT